jgi:hypothetical protein
LIVALNNDVPAKTLREFAGMGQSKRDVQHPAHGLSLMQIMDTHPRRSIVDAANLDLQGETS